MKRILVLTISLLLFGNISIHGATRTVGVGQTYTSIVAAYNAAQNGDTIEIYPGTYTGSQNTLTIFKSLIIRGVGTPRPILDATGQTVSGNKGIFVANADDITIENLEFTGASVPNDKNGAGIRIQNKNLTVRNCVFHHNENGLLGGTASTKLLIEYCDFYENGYGDGQSHNLYIGQIAEFTFQFNRTRRSVVGHLLKSRAEKNFILYNFFASETAKVSYEINLPQGGVSYIIGNQIQQGNNAGNNGTIISYREESPVNATNELYVINNTIVNDRIGGSSTFIQIAKPVTQSLIMNNIFVGSGTTVSGTAIVSNNFNLAASQLVNASAYDYRLIPTSTAIDAALDPGIANGFNLKPTHEYVAIASGQIRPQYGQLDAGALEAVGNNRPPTVTAGANPTSGSTPLVVSFTATASDPDGDTLSYAWTFGDGGTSNQQNPNHTYYDAGTYTPQVTVTDSNGGSASDLVQITVTPGLFPLTINTAGTGEGMVNVSPPGLQYTNGTQITLTAVPTNNSTFAGWNGKVSGQQNPITFTMNGSATVTAGFDVKTFTITSLASTDGGSIEPQGEIQVIYGSSQSFTIIPSDGYMIDNVLTNGYPVGAVTTFTFNNVQSNHTIQAFFKVDDTPPTITSALVATGTVGQAFSYQITATHSPHSYAAVVLPEGLSVDTETGLISGTPAVGLVTNVVISAINDGGSDTKQLALTINGIVEASAGENGSITPSGSQAFAGGTSPVFNINPAQWYSIADVVVDGTSVGKSASYTFVNISTNHTIAVTFSAQLAALGTPLWWLAQYLEINEGFDAAELLDSDNDGFVNWREYQLGTDPTDPLSRPAYNVVPYAESFEDLSGFGGTYGLISGFKGWFAADSGDQSRIVNAPQPLAEAHRPLAAATHTNILQLSTSDKSLVNSFGDGFDMGSQRLYIDQAMSFEMYESAPSNCTTNDSGTKTLLFANTDNKLCVYHGVAAANGSLISNIVSVTDTTINSDTWYRVTLTFDTIPQSQAPLMFSIRINGQLVKSRAAYAGTWKAAYNVSNEMPATDPEGCWFRSATDSDDHGKLFRSLHYHGSGYLDDLVVTTVDPFEGDPGIETFLLSVTGSGSGSSSLGSLPYVQVTMDSGSSTQVVYTAADWYRISDLTANGAPINAAVGLRCYTQQIASISGNISNAVVFAEATQSQAGHGDVPLSWLKQWSEDAVRNQGDGFDVATKYLLGLDPTGYSTFALTIADLKIDGNKVITTVKRNVTGDLAPNGMAGYLKLQLAEQLGDTFETIVDTPITGATIFDANDCHTYTNTLDITTRFIRAVINESNE